MGGKQPYWQDSLMRKVIWPAAKRAGISKRIGWHTFRRSLASLLVGENAPVKLTQEIMRHANARITLELYAQSTMPAKQALQAQLVSKWNGGDDGTRTRGLCRDRVTVIGFSATYKNRGSCQVAVRNHYDPTHVGTIVGESREISGCLGSKLTPFFHMIKVMAAILRARVRRAMLVRIPFSTRAA